MQKGNKMIFNSKAEFERFLASYKPKPRTQITKEHYLVMCSFSGNMRKTKKLYDWEYDQAHEGKLLYCLCTNKDTLVIEDTQGLKYKVRVRNIPDSDVYVSDITLLQDRTKAKVSSYKLNVSKIYVHRLIEKPKISKMEGDWRDVAEISL